MRWLNGIINLMDMNLSKLWEIGKDGEGTSGFLSISDSDLRIPAELGQESQASYSVEK